MPLSKAGMKESGVEVGMQCPKAGQTDYVDPFPTHMERKFDDFFTTCSC